MASLYKLRKDLTGEAEREKAGRGDGLLERDSARRGWKGGGGEIGEQPTLSGSKKYICLPGVIAKQEIGQVKIYNLQSRNTETSEKNKAKELYFTENDIVDLIYFLIRRQKKIYLKTKK